MVLAVQAAEWIVDVGDVAVDADVSVDRVVQTDRAAQIVDRHPDQDLLERLQ